MLGIGSIYFGEKKDSDFHKIAGLFIIGLQATIALIDASIEIEEMQLGGEVVDV